MSDYIVLGDGIVSVDGQIVKGSRLSRHDPIIFRQTDDQLEQAAQPVIVNYPGLKWCSCPYHAEALRDAAHRHSLPSGLDVDLADQGWMPLEEFGARPGNADKKASWCNPCEAYRKRRQRQKAAEQEGRDIRPYERTTP